MNVVILQGRMVDTPSIRQLDNGKTLAEFSLAVRRPGNGDEADFFRCTAWENNANFIAEYFDKGDGLIVEGYLRQERWKDKETQTNRETIRVVVQNVQFPLGKKGGEKQSGETAESGSTAPAGSSQAVSEEDKVLQALSSIP